MPAFVLPQFLLCGLLVPRDALPRVLRAVSDVLPLSYAVDAMRTVTASAAGASQWPVTRGRRRASSSPRSPSGRLTLRRRTP